jgi:hypothetical protein
VADEVRHTSALGGVEHATRVGGVERERLLADHVLAGVDGRDRHRCVRVRRCGDGDGDDIRQRERGVEIGERRRDLAPLGAPGRAVGVGAHQRDDVEAGGAQRGDVHPAPEPGADDDRRGVLGH